MDVISEILHTAPGRTEINGNNVQCQNYIKVKGNSVCMHVKVKGFCLSCAQYNPVNRTVKFLVTWQATNAQGIRCCQIIKESQKGTRNMRY